MTAAAPSVSGEAFPAGYCHFPRYEEDYFRQLTSESFIKGHWVLGANARNEALDARVYARAAASIYGIDRFIERTQPILIHEVFFQIGDFNCIMRTIEYHKRRVKSNVEN